MQPKLLNPITVEIKQIDNSKTVFDDGKREPGTVIKRYISFKIKAQVYFLEDGYMEVAKPGKPDPRNLAGLILRAKGYIVVRKKDLLEVGKVINVEDQMVSYGNVGFETPCSLYFIGHKDAAHYSDKGSPTLQKWFFEDRK